MPMVMRKERFGGRDPDGFLFIKTFYASEAALMVIIFPWSIFLHVAGKLLPGCCGDREKPFCPACQQGA